MKRTQETKWESDKGEPLLRAAAKKPEWWTVYPSGADAETLMQLGEAILDALQGTAKGDSLLRFADVCERSTAMPRVATLRQAPEESCKP